MDERSSSYVPPLPEENSNGRFNNTRIYYINTPGVEWVCRVDWAWPSSQFDLYNPRLPIIYIYARNVLKQLQYVHSRRVRHEST